MKLKEFITKDVEEVKIYDFSNDVCDYYIERNNNSKGKNKNNNVYNKKYFDYIKTEGFDKYIKYREFKNEYGIVIDPDSKSTLLQEIYKILWDKTYINQDYMKKNDNEIWSDTLTSAHTRIKDYLVASKALDKTECGEKDIISKYKKENSFKSLLCDGSEFEILRKLTRKYHTLGNYCPVPVGFNKARSGYGVYDCCILTLEKIKEFYQHYQECKDEYVLNTNICALLELLQVKTTYDNCLKWLKSFNDWPTFVKENYFQDYVVNFDKGDFELKKIGNISWNNPTPKTTEDCIVFCDKTCDLIDKRSERMFKELVKRIDNKESN